MPGRDGMPGLSVVHNDPYGPSRRAGAADDLPQSPRPAEARWLEDLPETSWSAGRGLVDRIWPPAGWRQRRIRHRACHRRRQTGDRQADAAYGVEGFAPFEQELKTFRLVGGEPYAELIRQDVSVAAYLN